jgi:hypothetical protein
MAATWKPVPGCPGYEASDEGQVRSIDRAGPGGRTYLGTVLATRVSNSGYQLVDLRDAQGARRTRTVHRVVLEAFRGPCPPGLECRHLNDEPADNRLANLAWGTKTENAQDKFRLGNRQRAAAKPERLCVRCGTALEPGRGGKRCHGCVVDVGRRAAAMLRAGVDLDEAADLLGYPHLSGLHTLARVHGGYGVPPLRRWSRAVMATFRHRPRAHQG